MRVTFVDDSIPFDGNTPATEPLGGPEKALASLPGALARSGHVVEVFNRCLAPATIEGANWHPWHTPRPAETDILVAFRKPELLGVVAKAKRRFLWITGAPDYLGHARNRAYLERWKPVLLFLSRSHVESHDNEDKLRAAILTPGLRPPFLAVEANRPADPPRAIVTAHPLHGLDWLLDVWRGTIHAIAPQAELHVYSAALDKAQRGEPFDPAFRALVERLGTAKDDRIVVRRPPADPELAETFRQARVHLHPGHESDMYAFSIAESQSCGLPAVVRPKGAARERLIAGTTGFVAGDEDAFANAALRLLNDNATFERMSLSARTTQLGRRWDEVAAEFEVHW
ncbi:MAG: glycosyltransferase [Alphaproteobacteria bacterium]